MDRGASNPYWDNDDPWSQMESVVSPLSGMSLKNTHSFTYNNELVKNSWVTIVSVTYSNLALERWASSGENEIQIIANLEVTVTFSDGSTDSVEGGGGTLFILNKGSTATTSGSLTLVDVGVIKTLLD